MKRIIKFLLFMMVLPMLVITTACNPDDKSINIFTIQDDIALGQQVAAEIAGDPAKFPVLSRTQYPAAYEHLDRIMNAILATKLVTYDTVFPWTTYIIKGDSVVNAFATPGGQLYFYTGIIKELENEAQLAGVMANEMAHCSRRHSTDQLTRYYGLSLLVAIVLGENPSMLNQIAADLASGLAALAFSRQMEYEADAYAIKYLSSTDYHPLGLADFFIRMEGLPQPPTFLSTHPSPEDRIDKINEAWAANGSKVGDYFEVRYQSFKAALP